jgi:hypothetical protein
MVLRDEDRRRIKIPNGGLSKKLYEDFIEAISKDSKLLTQSYVRFLVSREIIPKEDERKVLSALSNFRGKYYFLNEISGVERRAEANKGRPGNINPKEPRYNFKFGRK